MLFDLDGTLVDPAGSITGGISAALEACGLPVPDAADLQRMVGPALVTSLREIAGVPEGRISEVVAHYRAGYRESGMAGSRPYPGVAGAVEALRAGGAAVAVATQKPEPLARDLLRMQGLAGLFDSVHGSPADERAAAALDGKASIIRAALDRHAGRYDRAVMVGDRRHDVEGAAANGLECIGVSWGFAPDGELAAAGAAAVAGSAGDLLTELERFRAQERDTAHGRL
ncbi:HAD hydrolase-like protein [Arthrobacter sp. ATA002]|uniref:HAD hydrolase-like protein n=1 Tax=Arthrobacter sp. ATA002 TaxID=2991715 RepID=UPI0022A73156|nr:HAD hydrolase-like protein [Arthrobacter sp. ATA002]WAP53242.1 HAD hydrolase-like protein [Arthrobacter sp. ATA002]